MGAYNGVGKIFKIQIRVEDNIFKIMPENEESIVQSSGILKG